MDALLWGEKPAEIIRAAEQSKIHLIISEEIVNEISQVLNYPKLKQIHQVEKCLQNFILFIVHLNKKMRDSHIYGFRNMRTNVDELKLLELSLFFSQF